MKILISGSREAAPELLQRAHAVTVRAWYRGFEILVGDAPGIDAQVVQTAEKFEANYCCYGVLKLPRNGAKKYTKVGQAGYGIGLHARYVRRDRFMLANAEMVVCIWNGRSSGTKRVFDEAVQSGKRAYLYNGKGLIEKFEPVGKG